MIGLTCNSDKVKELEAEFWKRIS